MANRIKGLTIEIGGDTTKLSDSLKDVDKSLKDTQTQLKDVNKLLKLDPTNVDLLKQRHELLGKAVNYNQFFFLSHLFSPPSYLVSTDLESICTPGLMVVER